MADYHIVYYDDTRDEGMEIKSALERAWHGVDVQVFEPPQDFRKVKDQVANSDLFLVDFDLARAPEDSAPVGYVGTTLVSHLKSLVDDRPVVVMTKHTVLDSLSPVRQAQLRERLACDDLVIKQDVLGKDTMAQVARLRSLTAGYRALQALHRANWMDILEILGVDQESLEAYRVHEASPPLEPNEKAVSTIAAWIRNVVMKYPGVLYDDRHAATNLGISLESFQSDAVQQLVQTAKYTGVFAADEFCRYWWKDRLRAIAISILEEAGSRAGVIPGFAEVLRSDYGIDLTPARCIWDGTDGADQVCYLLEKPVKLEHSLAYYADSRPAVMDQPRVSFRAMREHPDFEPELLDPSDRELCQAIMNLDDPAVTRGTPQ